jgi:hypothetical protein
MTDVQKVKLLVFGNEADTTFTDTQIQAFLDLQSGSVFYAAATACDSLASKVGANLKEVRIGDFTDYSGKNQVTSLQAQAKAFRDWEDNTPAFSIAEEGLSEFNYYIMVRNNILRTDDSVDASA